MLKFLSSIENTVNHAVDQFLFGGVFKVSWGMKLIVFLLIVLILVIMRFTTNKNNPVNKGLSWVVTGLGIIEMIVLAL
jgi:flagellar biogenesis protein FliO